MFFDLVINENSVTRFFASGFFTSLSLVSMTQAQAVNVNLGKGEITWARICKRLWSPGIDSEESIPPAYAAWRAGTTNRVAVPGWESISGLLKRFTNTGSVLLSPDVNLLWNCRWLKFTAGDVDSGGPKFELKISWQIFKEIRRVFLGLSGVEKSWFIKNPCVKHLVTLSLLTKNQLWSLACLRK